MGRWWAHWNLGMVSLDSSPTTCFPLRLHRISSHYIFTCPFISFNFCSAHYITFTWTSFNSIFRQMGRGVRDSKHQEARDMTEVWRRSCFVINLLIYELKETIWSDVDLCNAVRGQWKPLYLVPSHPATPIYLTKRSERERERFSSTLLYTHEPPFIYLFISVHLLCLANSSTM